MAGLTNTFSKTVMFLSLFAFEVPVSVSSFEADPNVGVFVDENPNVGALVDVDPNPNLKPAD